MDDSKDANHFFFRDNKEYFKVLQDMKYVAISLTLHSKIKALKVVNFCQNRNEAMVNQDVTPLIVLLIKSIYLKNGVNVYIVA